MRMHRRAVLGWVASTLWLCQAVSAGPQSAPPPAPALSCSEMEAFLKTAKVGRQRGTPVGVTAPSRATLSDGTREHDASIQTVDISKPTYQTNRGTELNFRDSWQFNVAGYELAKLLELNMVPPYVERRMPSSPASLSWWVNDAMMEKDRYQKKINPPDPESWNREMFAARVFHELIADTDFNMTNVLITKDWRIWLIDFSRAFRLTKTLQNPKQLTKADRKLLVNLRGLTAEGIERAAGRWLDKGEIDGVVARRDLIVQFFDKEVAAKGEAAVLYDFSRTSEPCGTGLQ